MVAVPGFLVSGAAPALGTGGQDKARAFLNCRGNILVQPSRMVRENGRLRRPERFFAGFAHVAFPEEMPHAQNLHERLRTGERMLPGSQE